MNDTQAAALLEPLMAATDEYAAAYGHPNEREAVRAAAIAFAVAVLDAVPCDFNWEDGRACTFADIGLEDACVRCCHLAIWKGMQ